MKSKMRLMGLFLLGLSSGVFAQTGSVEATVWDDQNANSVQNGNEPKIENVTVELYTSANSLVGTTTTDVNGQAKFNNLADGSYYLKFILPADHRFTHKTSDPLSTNGRSDANVSGNGKGKTSSFSIVGGSSINYVDAGMWAPGTVKATVWDDQNANRVQNGNEPKLPGVTVELLDDNNGDAVLATSVTDASGIATFNDVPADRPMKLKFVRPANHKFTPKSSGPITDNNNSDANQSGNGIGKTASFSIARGSEVITYVDAGLWAPGTVKATVWDDQNANRVQNGNEPKMPNVTVELLDDNNGDAVLASTLTDANGLATFNNVPADRPMKLRFVRPANHRFTPKSASPITDNNNSDANQSGNGIGKTASFSIARGSEVITYVDAGLWAPGTVKATVWDDQNANSVQNGNEPKIPNVTVELLDDNNGDAVLQTTTTDANGLATFNNVPADRPMKLRFVRPADHRFTPKSGNPITDNNNSDANQSGNGIGKTASFSIARGSEVISYVDAGLWAPATVYASVWDDQNANSVKNGNEPPLIGVKVQLLDDNNGDAVLDEQFTGLNGVATFNNVPADRPMKLKFFRPDDHRFTPKSASPITDNNKSDANQSGNGIGKTASFNASRGSENITYVDAGMWAPGQVNAQVWLDKNGNGIKNGNEDGIYAFRVNLLESNNSPAVYPQWHKKKGQPITALTSCGNGIANLYLPADRSFKLEFEANGATFVQKGTNILVNNNSDPNPSGNGKGRTATFSASRGSDNITYVDAGVSSRGNLFDDATVNTFVFDDRNADYNHQGEGAFGIEGVKVSLTDLQGNECACATTNANGQASIPAVSSYAKWFKLKFHLKEDHKFTGRTGNITNDKNNDAKSDGSTNRFKIENGDVINYVEAGMFAPGTLNTFVFDDRNADGNHQGEGGFGIEGVDVHLVEMDGSSLVTYPAWHPNANAVVTANPTTANGIASFDYVPADRWVKLKFDLKEDHRYTGRSGNIKNDKNNDVKSDGTTDRFRIEKGSELINYVECGKIAPGTINTFVFDDRNADRNHQGEGGFGIDGVTVELVETDGTTPVNYPAWHSSTGPVTAALTGNDGKTSFDYVPADRFVKLKYTLKEDHRFTGRLGGIKNDKNNDAKSDGTTDRFRVEKGSETINYVEAGKIAPGTLNTFVFDDRNADNNHQGEGGFGIDGVTVELIETNGNPVMYPSWYTAASGPISGVTGNDGKTSFDYVPADRFVKLKYTLKEGHQFTGRSGDIMNDKNNDAKSDGTTNRFRVEKGSETINYVEAGKIAPGTLTSFVWNDANNDGNHLGEGRNGISGVTVQLVEADGITPVNYPLWYPINPGSGVPGKMTNSSGNVFFDYVPADRHVKLLYTLPNGYSFTSRLGSITNQSNSDAKSNGSTDRFKVAKGSEHIKYVEAGLRMIAPPAARFAAPNTLENEAEAELNLKLYPNPTSEILNVSFELNDVKNARLRVVDMLGKIMIDEVVSAVDGQNILEMNVSNLPQGNYLLQMIYDDHLKVRKFIVTE